jgi:hypothetical protein
MSFLSKEDAIGAAKGLGGMALLIAAIYFSAKTESLIAMTLAGAIGGFILCKVATKGVLANCLKWAAFGAAAGFGFYLAL